MRVLFLSHRLLLCSADALIVEQLDAISQEWLQNRHLSERGFTRGRFSPDAVKGVPFFICESRSRVEAFCLWLPYWCGQGVVLDLMRRRRDTLSGTMDLLLDRALATPQSLGFLEGSLASAPLAGTGETHGPFDPGVALLFERMNSSYGYENLYQFKNKFVPRWESRYLVFPTGAELLRVVHALTRLQAGDGLTRLIPDASSVTRAPLQLAAAP